MNRSAFACVCLSSLILLGCAAGHGKYTQKFKDEAESRGAETSGADPAAPLPDPERLAGIT